MRALRLIAEGQKLESVEVEIPTLLEVDEDSPFVYVLIQVQAAGICHSDEHYRHGTSSAKPLPKTLGHEISGIVQQIGSRKGGNNQTIYYKGFQADPIQIGDRVCLHYLVTCEKCSYCIQGNEQFCKLGKMLGKDIGE